MDVRYRRRRRAAPAAAAVLLATLALTGCRVTYGAAPSSAVAPGGSGPAPAPAPAPDPAPGRAPGAEPSVPAPGACHTRGSAPYVLPDPSCTPGATNPQVSQADIRSTICVRGWTAQVRPPEAYTEALKSRQMAAYGDDGRTGVYEEDHLVPLELGGAPSDPRNLWPEPGPSPNAKDRVESAARRAVCSGELGLADAQRAIASDWISLGQQLGVAGP